MRLSLKLAYKNLIGAGLRTWLNVGVLSFTFVVIIFYNAFLNGWQNQARTEGIEWEYGSGQLQNEKYDPYDAFSITDGHGTLLEKENQGLEPVLVRNGTIYPNGRMVPILIKALDINQNTVKIPTHLLSADTNTLTAVIGKRMAASSNLKIGDEVLLRWRDKNGTYDAATITIAGIFNTTMVTVDNGQLWVSLDQLRRMTGLTNQTSYFIAGSEYNPHTVKGWQFISQKHLLKNIDNAVGMERASSTIIYLVLLSVALLAIFDTQVLSIFRRQKEIGTFIALGMTRTEVTRMFTMEGAMYAIFAAVVGSVYGIPLFLYTAAKGLHLLINMSDGMGLPMADTIYPVYGFYLIAGTFVLVVASATLVSYLPARKIAKMNPVNALKGKIA